MDSQQPTQPTTPHSNNINLNMDKLIEQLFERQSRLEEDVRKCHENHRETLEMQNGAIVRTIEQNTRILERIEQILQRLAA